MAKPFIKISYNGKGEKNSSVIPSLDYITRNLEEYKDRKDLISLGYENLPVLYKKNKNFFGETTLENVKDYYKDFMLYSRKDRRTNLNLVFDLPQTKDKKSFESVDEGIYNKIVSNFIKKIHDSYVLITENDKTKVYKVDIARKMINDNNKLEMTPIKIPIFYAIHKLEKNSKLEHPHCHMIISSLCFNEEQINTRNLSKELLIRSGFNNEQFSKVAFYYNVYVLLTKAVNEELDKLAPDKKTLIDKYFINLKNQNILKEDKISINKVAEAFKKIESPNLSYRENLQMNNMFDQLSTRYKEVETQLKEISEKKKKVISLFQIHKSDKKLIETIAARNKLYETLLFMKPRDNFVLKTIFQENFTNLDNIDFNSYKVLKNIKNGINIEESVKPKLFLNKPELIPYYFNYGSMKDYIKVIEENVENYEIEENFEKIEKVLDNFSNEYYDAVKKYNDISPFELKRQEKTLELMKEINSIDSINVNFDNKKFIKKRNKIVEKIATMDFQILSALEIRDEKNLIKQYYLTRNFGEDIEEISLEDYIEENSIVKYEILGKETQVRLSVAFENLEKLNNQLNILKNQLQEEIEKNIKEEIKNNIKILIEYKNNIEKGIKNFEIVEKVKLIDKFNKTIKNKSLNLSKSKKEFYAKQIDTYKDSILNSKLKPEVEEAIKQNFKDLKFGGYLKEEKNKRKRRESLTNRRRPM